jgi:DNA-binding NarL/FixJ family response regulator
MSIHVLLADDQELVRAGLRALIERDPELSVVGDGADGAEAVALAAAERPDVVLMDLRMPRVDGIEATRHIVADPALARVRVVALTTYGTDEHVFAAIRPGAVGFLLKDRGPEKLRRAVRLVAPGEALLSPSVTRRVMEAAVGGPGRRGRRTAGGTDRPRTRRAGGSTASEPGDRAHLRQPPVTKLGARDRAPTGCDRLPHRPGTATLTEQPAAVFAKPVPYAPAPASRARVTALRAEPYLKPLPAGS